MAAATLAHAAQASPSTPAPEPRVASRSISASADELLRSALRARLPKNLQGRAQSPDAATSDAWADLPEQLDGRVRLGMPGADAAGRAGWRMLDVPSARRIELARGAAYVGEGWDVLQSVDEDRLREYVVVNRHQGVRTWRWQLYTSAPGIRPRITADGRIDLGDGFHIEPPKLLDANLTDLDRPVRWSLDGSVLELRVDDRGLALPYVIDPDATPPEAGFVQWDDSDPHAYYNPANDLNRLWFNPDYAGSAVGTIAAVDPESAVDHVSWPTPPSGWLPAGSDDSSATDASGLLATYWDNAQRPGSGGCTASPQYPCSNFTGIYFNRIDPDVAFNWGTGTPYTELGVDTFSVRWVGKIEAPETGTYYFQTRSDDGIRLWVDGTEMASRWDDHGPAVYSGCAGGINLVAGTKYDIKAEFYENGGGAVAELRWRLPSQAGSYRTPTGCSTNTSPPRNHATGTTGGGSTNYPSIPSSALSTGGGNYTRTFTWAVGASGGTANATATNGDAVSTSPFPIEWVADNTPPTGPAPTTFYIQTPGWGTSSSNRIYFPTAGSFSDAGSSATGVGNLTREIQRKDGVSDGVGGCDTSAGTWTTIATNPGGTSINNGVVSIPAAGTCSQFRYLITDEVGNELEMLAADFRGWDGENPSGTVVSITEGTNPEYQYVSGANVVYFNGNQSGDFTVEAAPTDGSSGPAQVRFYGLGTNWTPSAGNLDIASPGPWTQSFAWTSGAADAQWENIRVDDFAGRNATITNAWRVIRDNAAPTGGTLTYGTPAWVDTPDVPWTMSATMSDALSGVASYQLQRDEAPWGAGSCGAFPGTYATNIGAAVTGDPPASLGSATDSTVADGTCYRYRVEAVDNVGNVGYLTPGNDVMVDDTDPVAALDALPSSGSGTINVSGTSSDTMSGVASVTVRIENQASPGVFTTIYTDTTTPSPTWGPYAWDTSSLNGTYNIYVDVTDVAGNTVVAAAPNHTILLDNSPPTLTFDGFTEGTNPACQHVDPLDDTIAWVRTTGACSGDIVAHFTPDDPESGIDHITVPAGTAGWTPATATDINAPGPYEQAYAWAAAASPFGTQNATATSGGGLVSTNTPFTIQLDDTAPASGAISYPTTWTTAAPIAVSIDANYTDADSGIYHQQLLRDEVARTAADCGAGESWPGTYATVVDQTVAGGAIQTLGPVVNDAAVSSGMCYRYKLVATDNVGNTADTGSTPTAARTDFDDPTAALDAAPPSPFTGTIAVTGTADDATAPAASGVASITLRWKNLDDMSTGTVGTDTTASPTWSVSFDTATAATPDGNYRLFVDVVDNAGNTVTDADTRDVVIDNSPPTIDLVSFTEGSQPECQHWTGLPSTTFWFSLTGAGCGASSFDVEVTADDPPGGLADVTFPALGDPTPSPATDSSSPYTTTYSYTTSAGNPGSADIVATGNSGATTPLSITVSRDDNPPSGATLTGPGGTSSPTWWTTASSTSVTFDVGAATDAESGVRTGAHQLQRREATDPTCTTWGSWTDIGAAGESSPYADSTLADGTCYQYGVQVYDNTNNVADVQDTTNVLRVDQGDPTGTIDPVPAYVSGSSFTLTGTSSDDWSGVASISLRIGAGPAVACTPAVAASWTCSWDTTATADGPVTLTLELADEAGNTVDAATANTTVDNAAPTGSVALAEGTNDQWQFVDSSAGTPRIWINTAEAGGDFTATVTASDPSGIFDVDLPDLGSGWTPAGANVPTPGPYATTYTWTGPTPADPGSQNVTIRDAAMNTATAPFIVQADTTDPIAGSIQYAGGPSSGPSITFSQGSDADSGVASWRIERDEANLTGPGTCDPFPGTWTTVATDPAVSPWTDGTVAVGTCYQYRLVVVDNVGNEAIWNDPETDVVTTEPPGIVIVESGASTDVTEGGATDTYDVTLRTIPASNVTITIANADGQVTASSPTLTFTPANWNVVQTVTVTAVDDDIDELPDPNTGTLTHVAASADSDYDGLVGADVVANVTDNDDVGITVSPDSTSVDVAEAGATSDTYTIVLDSEPTADVTIDLANADGQVTVAPATLTFTSGNWDTPQTVTVTAVDDPDIEAATHPGVVTHAVSSADPMYDPLTVPDVTANVTDDDVAGITVAPTSGLSLDEAAVGTTAQYTVVLDSRPTGDVNLTVTGDGQATPDLTNLLFTYANWDTPQTVTMTVVDDLVVEGAHTSTVSHLAASADTNYDGIPVSPVTIDITDNDIPGIEVTPAGPMSVAEGGATDTYQIRLETQPTADVQVAFTTDAQLDAITTLTFTTANWNAFQDVVVSAVDDDIDEADPHSTTIAHVVTSSDPTYDGWTLADMDVSIADDDTAGITIDELGGVEVDEANVAATDTFNVQLNSEPTAPITVTITPDAQTTTTATLSFDSTNWDTPQPVTVTAVDDPVDEADPHTSTIAVTAAGDPEYDLVAAGTVLADVHDDDTAGITISPGTLTLDETLPASDSYTVVLDSEPIADVTVDVTPDSQVTTTDTTLVFTPLNWSSPQTVTVEAVDDPTVEATPHAGQLTHSVTTTDPGYALVTPAAKDADITDNDTPAITIDTGTGVEATEGGATGTYTIVLDVQPATGQTVTVDLTDDAQVDVSPTQVVFDDSNWSTPQTITVTAVDDSIQELDPHPGLVTHAVSSTDPLWASLITAPDVNVDVHDNDVADIVVTASSPYALSEDTPTATVSYDVHLATQPSSDVTITLTVPGDLNADVTTLTFTDSDWMTDQTVTVNAIDDVVVETPVHTRTITHAVASGDAFYAPLTMPDIDFDVTDNDIPGITVDKTSLAVAEGGASDTFSVVLDTQPTADVTVTLTGTQVGFDVNPLVFTTANWSTPQTVTVDAIDDSIDESPDPHSGLVALAVTSPDGVYDGWTLADIPVDVTDNDTAGVTVTPGSGTPLSVAEAATTSDTYTVQLDTEPTADVTITIDTADGQTTTDLSTLTFTSTDWMTPQTVTVTAVDDQVDETDPHPGLVTHVAASADPHYDAITVDDQTVDIADDDTAGIDVSPVTIALDESAPATTATFDVVLLSQPAANVDVALDTSDGQTTTDVPSLTFTPANWATPQTVTVSVVDDLVDETDPHPGVIGTLASSTDPSYDGFDPADVDASIVDDDVAGVSITETGGSTDVDEAGLTDTYEVVLETKPLSDVTITITGGPDATTDLATLTFTPANWSTAQVVTVSGVPDSLVEGPHTQVISHTASSLDLKYDGIAVTIPDVIANVTDDDVAGATLSVTNVAVAEGGTTATYDVVLDAEPTADVTITITPDAQLSTDLTTLTFTPADWDTPQTVTVTAVDDFVTEPTPHAGTITHTMSSSDTDFDGVPVSDLTADIDDNDIPGVTVSTTTTTAEEGGATGSFDVVLDSNPGANVDVTFSEPGQLDPIGTLTFTPADWDTPQTVTVTAFDDFIMEGPHTTTITIDTSAPGAPLYDTGTLTITPVDVDITDNDFAGVLLAPPSGLAGAEGDVVTYQMSLTSEPTDTIEITLAGDADGTPALTTYTFTPADWATPQDVDVTLVQDLIDEGGLHTTTITGTISNAGTDAFYGAVTVDDQVIDITDDDTAGVTFNPVLPGPLAIAEGGATATYDVVLDTEPTGDVTIDMVALAGQATASPATLTFTPTDWMNPQTVTVTAVDDDVAETTPHSDSMTHVAGGADPIYASLVLGDMDLAIDDNDTAGVHVDITGPDTTVEEGGATDDVTVVLESEPTSPVTVTLTGVQVDLSPNPLTFDASNWDTPQTVTVTAIDDDVFEGPHAGTIDAATTSADTFYDGLAAAQQPVSIVDNDTAGVIVTQPAANDLDEDTPAVGQTYQVRLESEPTAPVDVVIAPDAQVTTTPTTLTFTPGDWDTDQDVTVFPVDDFVSEADPHPGVVSHDTTSADPSYDTGVLTIDDVTVSIADNDTPGIQITPTTGHVVAEGGATSTYDIVLLSQPTADVVLAPVSAQLEWTVPDITFTSSNWSIPQTVTLQAIDDHVDEADPHPGTLDMTVTSADAGYAALVPDTVDASIGDNDTSDLVVTPATGLAVDEDGALGPATYTLTLTSIPSAPVDVAITPDAQLLASAPTVTLDGTNWDTGVTVDITAVDDLVAETSPHAGIVAHAMSSADPNFDGETGPDATADITDNDTAGVTITATAPDTTVAEDGSITDTYDVVLDTKPTDDVTITISPDPQVATAQATLTFTPANWDTAQTVDVTAVDDHVIEGAHTGTIAHTAASSDPFYDGITIADETANVLDDDVAGVVVTPAGGTFEIAEGGTGDTLTLTLTSKPLAPVTVLVTTDAQATASPASVVLDDTNWDTGQDVTIDAVDDGYIEGSPHPAVVSFAIDPGSDPDYVGLVIPDETADVTDNDAAAVLVDVLDGISLDEADVATTDTYEVRLQAAPAPGETVDVNMAEAAPGGQLTLSTPTLTFDDSNWNVAQPVTVTVIDDALDETDPHTQAITFTTSSGDTNFDALAVADIDATIADNDDSGLVVDTTSVAVDETGPTSGDVKVHLATRPYADVEVAVTFDSAQVSITTPTTLTFTPADWDTDQTVTIEAYDDSIDELDPHQSVITLTPSSVAGGDPNYDAVAPVDVTADITDDDTSDIVVSMSAGPDVDEANPGSTVTWDVQLASQPTANVDLVFAPDAQLELVSGGTLTFTPGDWSTPQQVEVRAHDDSIDEADPHAGTLSITVSSPDSNYAALTPADLTVDVHDDDTAGVLVDQTPAPQDLAEDGSIPSATYTVVLQSQPTDDVTIDLATNGEVDTGATTTLTFTDADWNIPQPVTVTAVDDLVSEPTPHTGTITHTSDSADPNYAAAAALAITDATFAIADDDIPGFTITPSSGLALDEADVPTTTSFDVQIQTLPAGTVTVDLTTDGDVTVSPTSLTFDASNAATPQTVTVSVVDDHLVEGPETDHVHFAVSAAPGDPYDALAVPDNDVDVADDDVAAVVIDDGGGLQVAEAGATTDTFTVALAAEPVAAVTVDLAHDSTQLEAPSPASLVFTPGNWSTPQTVTVQPIDDHVVEGTHTSLLAFTTTSADSNFDALVVADQTVTIDDDDVAGITITPPADLTMDEGDVPGSRRTIHVALTSQPVVPVTIVASNNGQLSFPANVLTLDDSNWDTGVDLDVDVVHDMIAEADPHDGIVSFAVDPISDPDYLSVTAAPVTFSITDADTAGIACTAGPSWTINGSGHLDMAEDPGDPTHVVTCDIELASQSAADVTVGVATSPSTQLTVAPTSVTIPAGSTGPETLTFTAVDDAIAEGLHSGTIDFTVTTSDPIYATTSIASVDVDIADNDNAGISVTPAGPVALAEGGASQTVDVVLDSAPTAAVDIDLDGGAQVAAGPAVLHFLPTNWDVPQTVTLTAIDDAIDEADPHAGQVTFAVSSTDTLYDGAVVAPIDATITDNDTPGVIVSVTDQGNAVVEGGATDSFDVQLGTQPTATVTVTLTGDGQVDPSPTTLTFTPSTWNVAQTVTLTAVQDAIVEGEHQGNVTFALDSTDPAYMAGSASTPGAQAVTITDDDLPGIEIVQSDGSTQLSENGGTDSYTIALRGQPTDDVTIAITGAPQVTVSPETVVFTPATWSTPQTITVAAVDDSLDEPDPHPGEIRHTAVTDAAGWKDAMLDGVTASIIDNDTAEIVVEETDGSTKTEEGAVQGDTVTFRLSSQPTSDVSIVPTGDEQLDVSSSPIVLGPDSWRDPITLSVKAVDDEEVEGDHEGLLSFKVSSEDPSYAKATVASIIVAITDNDEDDGAIEDDTEDTTDATRTPRASVPPATIKDGLNRNRNGETPTRRTPDGATRTPSGNTRLPEGTGTTPQQDPGVRTGKRLGGEITASKKNGEATRKGPIASAVNWLGDHWKLWLPILALVLIAGGTLLHILRNDPARAARTLASRTAAGRAARDVSRSRMHLRGRRRRDDDDEDDEDGPA